jgi:hypothetical protein
MSEQSTVLDEAFDTENEEGTCFDLLPPNKYTAEIDDAKVAVTKNGQGQGVNLRWRIVEGERKPCRLPMDHDSAYQC